MPLLGKCSGPHTLNHHVFNSANSASALRIAWRKSIASMSDSSVKAVPPGSSIMAAAMSQDAMIEYCGLVDACIK